jgi:hypothetical protein
MNLKRAIAWVCTLLWFLGVLYAASSEDWRLAEGITSACIIIMVFMVPLMDWGDKVEGKNRYTASHLARVPGLGHLYLGRKKMALVFLAVNMLTASMFLLMVYSEDDLLLISNMGALIFCSMFLSVIDAEKVCIETIPEPLSGDGIEVIRYRFALLSVIVGAYAAMMLMTLCIMLFVWLPDSNIWLYVASSSAWTAVAVCAVIRYRQTRHLDPPKPQKTRGRSTEPKT